MIHLGMHSAHSCGFGGCLRGLFPFQIVTLFRLDARLSSTDMKKAQANTNAHADQRCIPVRFRGSRKNKTSRCFNFFFVLVRVRRTSSRTMRCSSPMTNGSYCTSGS